METILNGRLVRLRAMVAADAPRLVVGLRELSVEGRIGRFFYNKTAFSKEELSSLTSCDGNNQYAMVAELPTEIDCSLIAVSRWLRDPEDPAVADVAIVTRDDWQRLGIGTWLAQVTALVALKNGITRFRAQTLWGNYAAARLLEKIGALVQRSEIGAGASELIYTLHTDLLEKRFE